MKKLIKLVCVITLVFILAGCDTSTKEVINNNKLITIANRNGYPLSEVTSSYSYAKVAYDYSNSVTNTEIFFAEGDESSIINGIYIDEVTNYNNNAGSSAKKTTKKGKNYSVFIVENKNMYYIVSRVGKTFIKASTSIKNKSKLVDFIDAIGYY